MQPLRSIGIKGPKGPRGDLGDSGLSETKWDVRLVRQGINKNQT